MVLELFANNERTSNSPLFYREVSSLPYTVRYKLKFVEYSSKYFDEIYDVYYSLNNSETFPFTRFGITKTYDASVQSSQIFTVYVYEKDTQNLIETSSITCKFVDYIPKVDFIAFPQFQFQETVPYSQFEVTYSNFDKTSQGVYFYGEGHTETVFLSSTFKNPTGLEDVYWFVGNSINEIQNASSSSKIQIQTLGNRSASVALTSSPAQQASYPISVLAIAGDIEVNGPIITYDDLTNKPSFYSFFSSSLTPLNKNSPFNSKTRNNIQVRTYPNFNNAIFSAPFSTEELTLPFNGNSQTFLAQVTAAAPSNLFKSLNYATNWKVDSTVQQPDLVPDWTSETGVLTGITTYQFSLAYYKPTDTEFLPFKVSVQSNTTINFEVTALRTISLSSAPYDWLPRTQTLSFNDSVVINSLPTTKLYTDNFYNLTGVPIVFQNLYQESNSTSFLTLYKVVVSTINEPTTQTMVFSGDNLYGTNSLIFDNPGTVSFRADGYLKDINNNEYQISYNFPSFINVITQYEVKDEQFLQTVSNKKQTFSFDSDQFKLSPNEWVTANNFNSLVIKLHQLFESIAGNVNSYKNTPKFFGVLDQAYQPKLKWLELTCDNTEDDIYYKTWKEFANCDINQDEFAVWRTNKIRSDCIEKYCIPWSWEERKKIKSPRFQTTWQNTENNEQYEKLWTYEPCDPTCKQKYYIDWNWNALTHSNQQTCEIFPTWKNTKKEGSLEKLWQFEPYETDALFLRCKQTDWVLKEQQTNAALQILCEANKACNYTGLCISPITNRILLAYKNEIRLINSDRTATFLTRTRRFDSVFKFKNVVFVGITPNEKIVVVDGTLNKVGIFSIEKNKFKLLTMWGRLGSVTDVQGFNNPSSALVDSNGTIYICDRGNNCIKLFSLTGKHKLTITNSKITDNNLKSVCLDGDGRIHCLVDNYVLVFDSIGNVLFEYSLADYKPNFIASSYQGDVVFVTHETGILKILKTGYIVQNITFDDICSTNLPVKNFNLAFQDKFRNLFATIENKIIKVCDILAKEEDFNFLYQLQPYWTLSQMLVDEEEYIQPWVYLRSFHKLWDNIEIFRNSLTYKQTNCSEYISPIYSKEDLIIGQNEIVSNAVVNRLSKQIQSNLLQLVPYFNVDCQTIEEEILQEQIVGPQSPLLQIIPTILSTIEPTNINYEFINAEFFN